MQARLAEASEPLRAGRRAVSWTPPGNFHVTLKFLGAVEEPRVPGIVEALREAVAGHSAFAMTVHGLGAFPSASRPRVIWAGIESGAGRLTALARAVEAALVPLGFEAATRPFSAHVTLGRVREPGPDPSLARALARAAAAPLGETRVERLVLMRSELSPRGSRYTEVASLPLEASTP